MRNRLPILVSLVSAAIAAGACGFQHSTSVTGPTPAASNSSATPTTNAPGSTATSPVVGTWTSAPTLPTANSCGNFAYQISSQTGSSIAGTFTALCGNGVTVSGNVSGTVNGDAVQLTATGTATMSGVPCAFTLSGSGTIQDGGYTLSVPFSGTTCFGPVSGTEVLHKPRPAGSSSSIDAPAAVAPAVNQHLDGVRTRFTVTNATHAGTVGPLAYTYEVATDEGFSNVWGSWNVPEQPNQTSLDLPRDFSWASVYYWHVRAYDGASTGAWSITRALATPNPPAAPPVSNAGGGDAMDLHQVTSVNPNVDVASWPITTRITGLDFQSYGVRVDFSKKEGGDRWPDVVPPGWDGGIQYTLCMVVNIGGRWYTSGGVEYWHGLDRQGGPPSQFTSNWYYNPQVWGPLSSHQPAVGEQVGFFVTAGDQRAKDVRAVTERSNVVVVPFPSDGGAYYPF